MKEENLNCFDIKIPKSMRRAECVEIIVIFIISFEQGFAVLIFSVHLSLNFAANNCSIWFGARFEIY